MNHKPLILASASPRRRDLLRMVGFTFEIITADIDETPLTDEHPRDYVCRLSADKARTVAERFNEAAFILAADTTVADGYQILGKPADPAEAEAMLRQLRGRTHQVHTGIALLNTASGDLQTAVESTHVLMRNYTDQAMADYIASGDPFDKAGGYAIQNIDFHPVEKQIGCYTNVVGLPLCSVLRACERAGLIDVVPDRFQPPAPDQACSFCVFQRSQQHG